MKDYYPPLLPGFHYHIYNRGNNRETIFYTDENYRYFLEKYTKYLSPVLDTYAYCLLPNHFHLVARVKTPEEIVASVVASDFPGFKNLESLLPAGNLERLNLAGSPADFPGFKNLESLNLAGNRGHLIPAGSPSDFPGFKNLESLLPAGRLDDDGVGRLVSNQFRLCFMSYAKALNKQRGRTGSLFQKNFKRLTIDSDYYCSNLILYVHANPQLHGIWDDYRDWPHSSYASMLSKNATRLRRETVLDWFGGGSAFVDAHQHYLKLKIDETLMIED